MSNDYTATIQVESSVEEAFNAVNNVTAWWTENLEGRSEQQGDEFSVRFGDVHHSRQRLVEVVPNRRVVWLVTEGRLSFVEDKQEWVGTRIVFDLEEHDGQTRVTFTHEGLKPEVECFDACSNAWGGYIRGSLKNLIETGKGAPMLKESALATE